MAIVNKTKNTVLARQFKVADTFISRSVGLLNRSSLSEDEALILTRCQSIHMFFMRFTIDATFVAKNNEVVGIVENIKPFRLSPIFFKASYCIESAPGSIAKSQTSLGDVIDVQK